MMETVSGLKIEGFKKLDNPIDNGILEPHIYEGTIKECPMYKETKDQYTTWDKFGRCSNWQRSDCFIDVSKINPQPNESN